MTQCNNLRARAGSILAVGLLAGACGEVQVDTSISAFELLEITKWPGGSEMAYSSVLNASNATEYADVNNWLIERALFLDYPVVSTEYAGDAERADYVTEVLVPAGFGYVGHGHSRLNGQELDYNDALADFQKNSAYVREMGLSPVAFVYQDEGGGIDAHQRALQDAGFLSGVRSGSGWQTDGPCVLAGDVTAPVNWWALPSVRMQNEPCEGCAVSGEELQALIEACREEGGWLITVYDSLGMDGIGNVVGSGGYTADVGDDRIAWSGLVAGNVADLDGHYPRSAFEHQMEQIAEWSDEGLLWLATTNEATLFARQRRATAARLDRIGENTFQLFLDDGLDRSIYTAEMTLRLAFGEFFQDKVLVIQQGSQELLRVQVDGPEMLVNIPPSAIPYLLLFSGR